MKYLFSPLWLAVAFLGSCQPTSPTPTPQLTGTGVLQQYAYDQPNVYAGAGRLRGTVPAGPNVYIVISDQAIEFHDPAYTAPVTQAYTRQGNRLEVAASIAGKKVELITKLTAQELGLHMVDGPFGSGRPDSIVYDYSYTRQ